MAKKHIVVLTGAGISQESGIKTFRDSNGLWENHDIMEVASPQGFQQNPALVLDFYNQRRRQLKEVEPNDAHKALAQLESEYKVTVITQNVDDLHERAGSTDVIHLHGELKKMRSVKNDEVFFDIEEDIKLGDLAEDGGQLRPHIVWFGEAVPEMEKAIELTLKADIFIVIGTSMQVYPAASLIDYVSIDSPIYIVDPQPVSVMHTDNIHHIQEKAVEGTRILKSKLLRT
ncbi:NAD-dependent deacylase [Flavobacteriaceae bacterium Ap0902]|nr:NAD-dependent deacylase [Flavobacteriaceae bacterium Ap0902]